MLQDYLLGKLMENSTVGNKIQSSDKISEKGKYALDATEKNPNIEDSLAEQIVNLENQTNVLKNSVRNIISLPNGASTGDGQIEDAKIGIEGESYDTLGDAIREQIKSYRDVDVSNNKPEGKPKVWINTASNDDTDNDYIVPQINDLILSEEDTWSSEKINSKIEAMGEKINLVGLVEKKYNSKIDSYKWSPVNVQIVNGKIISSENDVFVSKITVRVKSTETKMSTLNVMFYHKENNTLVVNMTKSFSFVVKANTEIDQSVVVDEILGKGDFIGVSSPDCTIETCTSDADASLISISDGTNVDLNSIHAISTEEADYAITMVVDYFEYNKAFDSGIDKLYKDKNIVIFGDTRTWYDNKSYQEGVTKASGENCVGYQYWMKNYLGANITSRGFKDLSLIQICPKIKSYDLTDVSVLIIGNSITDWFKSEPIGELAEIGSSFDSTTIYGALQDAIEYALTTKPTLKIYLINPATAWKNISTNEETLSEEYKVICKNVAELYNLPFLDLSVGCGFNKLTRDIYYVDDTTNTDSYLYLNDAGNEVIGKRISTFLIHS